MNKRCHRSGLSSPRATLFKAEPLEGRNLPSALPPAPDLVPLHEVEPNDTLDLAQQVDLTSTEPAVPGQAVAVGAIGIRAAGGDVDWYRFSLTQPSTVTLASL